jgi:hypothetical protein
MPKQAAEQSKIGGSILDADPPPQRVTFPRRITPYVEKIVNDLFSAFAGYQMRQEAIEEWVKQLIERRL